MKTSKFKKSNLSLLLIIPLITLQLLGCLTTQTDKIKTQNLTVESPTPDNEAINPAKVKFLNDQKEKYAAISAELEQNRRLWEENKITNYDFVCHRDAGGVNGWGDALIKVRNNQSISIEKADKESLAKIDGYEKFDTVEKIFDSIKQDLESGNAIQVKYDKNLGYPKEVGIMFSYDIDSWTDFSIEKFKVIK